MKVIHSTVSALALGVALFQISPAVAQESSEAAEGSVSDGEIIVTALRRDQALSKAPVAIAAVSGDKLLAEGVTSAKDLQNVVPNIQVGPAGFSIRGVASTDFTEKGDPSTAFNLDGIYIARPTEQSLAMYDVSRVEVLRGPQGTLYGRNATAGVINVISNHPSDAVEVSGSAEYGNYNTVRLNGMVNTPINDSLAVRVAGTYNYHDGFTPTHDGHDALDDQDDFGIRGSVLAHLGSATTLYVSADYEQSYTNAQARVAVDRAIAQNDDHSLRYQNPGVDTYSKFHVAGVTAELNSDLGFAKLTYLAGYRKSKWRERASRNDIPAPFDPFTPNGDFISYQNHEQDSQELRLASQGSGPLQWVVGAYYFHEKTYTAPILNFPNFGFTLSYDLNASAKTMAGFGQVTYSLTPGVRVTGGIRYTDDKKSRVGTQYFGLNGTDLSFPSDYSGHYPGGGISGSKVTWKGGVEADITPDVLAYFNATSGYKAGGFNDGTPADVSPVPFYYRPETIISYEGGIKGTVLGRALYFSLTGFYYDYKDLQMGLVKNSGGAVTLNVPKADVKGIEFEGNWRVGSGTKIDFSAAYLDATFGDFFPLEGNTLVNFNGQELDRSPKFTGRVGLTQDFFLSSGGRISGTAALKYSSSYLVTDGNTATRIEQDSYTRTDVTLGYFAPDDRWYIQAFGRNLENKRLLGVFELASFTLTDPRQYGVRAGFKF
ncbi:TonB-dependent receptor [Novosphingobium mathurense]|uniref:Iron complex outermembrane recepter protein n=1 Tax=Novosphingobium mathurense TaxID=428990 RepID=A0A1U6IMD5_9SPHN|nr:TonB-dependent receptor [Novosphingobium mathurense]SLK09132.1 iron complex outermembrane recepter protein [Novosphingobium mathurense]